MPKKINNHKYLEAFRKELRKNPTKAEAQLWKALQRCQLEGRKFRRQHSIGNFIVDFYSTTGKLIVEHDGHYHANPVNGTYDLNRTKYLEGLGFKVLRFENYLVFE